MTNKNRVIIVYLGLALLVVLFGFVSVYTGTVNIKSIDPVMAADIIFGIRLPRLLMAAILGGALALSGYMLQTFFHNPIAGPFVLGISSASKLFVACYMIMVAGNMLLSGSIFMIIAAFLGSLLAMFVVLIFAGRLRSMSTLLVAGIMVGYICSAATDLLVTFAEDHQVVNLRNWSLGSFSGVNINQVFMALFLVTAGLIASLCLSKNIQAYLLGENYARSLGVNIRLFRVSLVILSSLLSATVTAFAGPISFVGIAVPFIIKGMLKSSKPILVIPACFLGGAVFCLFCDLLSRTLFAPTEISVSTVTAVFGAPVVIYMMLQKNKSSQ